MTAVPGRPEPGPVCRPLFVYGSLRDPAVRDRLLGERPALESRPARLPGYARQMSPGFAYPFVAPAGPESHVDGDLLLGLTPPDYAILDAYEDLDDGLYVRVAVTVETPAGPVEAWTYARGPNAP